jgi:hypothetical protein
MPEPKPKGPNSREPNLFALAVPGLAMAVYLVVNAVMIVRDRAPHAPWVRVAHLAVASVAVLSAVGIVGLLGWFIRPALPDFRAHWPGLRRTVTVTLVVMVLLALGLVAATR